jgi:hypothetical protein
MQCLVHSSDEGGEQKYETGQNCLTKIHQFSVKSVQVEVKYKKNLVSITSVSTSSKNANPTNLILIPSGVGAKRTASAGNNT